MESSKIENIRSVRLSPHAKEVDHYHLVYVRGESCWSVGSLSLSLLSVFLLPILCCGIWVFVAWSILLPSFNHFLIYQSLMFFGLCTFSSSNLKY
jgi:hypothetical protein